ncbi:MAG: CCA tRNA nucleotidyltransferase [Armatimonadota bacterium]
MSAEASDAGAGQVSALERAWRAEPLRRELSALASGGGHAAYLVGGAVRDLLLGRPVSDWDVAGHGMIELARRFAHAQHLRLVLLHEDFPTARVILHPRDPQGFVDLVELRAPTIEDDLRARDFTVNAIAWDVRGADHLVDPTGGLADLQRGIVRSPSREVLVSDPLRALRAFRFAAELGFVIEPQTGGWLAELAPRVWEVAGERIGQELTRLFAGPRAADALQQAEELGALGGLFPMLEPMRGVEQGGYHHLDVLGHTLLVLHEVERAINAPELALPRSAAAVRAWLAEAGNRAALRLAALFHDVGKPQCRAVGDGGVRFLGHADVSAEAFLRFAARAYLPTHMRRQVVRMVRLHMRPLELANAGMRAEAQGRELTSVITLRAVRRLMRDAEPAAIGLLLLAAADRAACRGPASEFEQRGRIHEIFDDMLARYLQWLRETQDRPAIIDGRELMAELGLEEGPLVGELLDAVADAYADRVITTRAQALRLARRLLRERGR